MKIRLLTLTCWQRYEQLKTVQRKEIAQYKRFRALTEKLAELSIQVSKIGEAKKRLENS